MDTLVKADDFTWVMAGVFIWSCCEPFVGILCACLPTYGPLLRKWWKTASSSDRYQLGETIFNLDKTNVRNNKARKEWKQLCDTENHLRQGDELGLANDISAIGSGSVRTKRSGDMGTTQDDPVI